MFLPSESREFTHCAALSQLSMKKASSFKVPSTAKTIEMARPDTEKIESNVLGILAEYAASDSLVATPSLSSYTASDFVFGAQKWDAIPKIDGKVSSSTSTDPAIPETRDLEMFSSILIVL